MSSPAEVENLRRSLGPVGAFLGVFDQSPPVEEQRDAVRRLEGAGYGAVWTNEIVGRDALVRASIWLAATERLVVGTGIANMLVRPAPTADAAAAQLNEAFPGRFVLGLGVGHPDQAKQLGREFGSPLTAARDYLRTLSGTYPRLLGANGPKMLALADELADGALPAGLPPDATASAREELGQDKLLVVYAVVEASADVDAVASIVREHLAAGADHVIVGLSNAGDLDATMETLERLAPTLTLIPSM